MKTYAGIWKRVLAFIVDYFVIIFYMGIMSVLFLFLFSQATEWLFTNRVIAQIAGFILITLPVTLYFSFYESSSKQATLGKQRVQIKVTDENSYQISFSKALIRNVLKFLPWEISHTLIWQITFYPDTNPLLINLGFGVVYLLVGLNIASMLITKTNQTLYDLITKTYIIKI